MIPKQKITAFQKQILDWYAEHKRDLPWRALLFDREKRARDPYAILVSEMMAQQTQLARVIPKYAEWMNKFPTIERLVKAKTSEVLHYWNGLGYNRRALHLKKLAEIIVLKYHGEFPRSEKDLIDLPGIGKYTARAILCFAFDEQVAVVDTNVRKVILTQFKDELRMRNYESGDNNKKRDLSNLILQDSIIENNVSDKEIEDIAQMLLPANRAYEWNQALMDYAATVLKKEKIPLPKQSKFIGSHRYYRGQVLKILLKKKKVSVDELGILIKKDYVGGDENWLLNLLEELKKEGFIFTKNKIISLTS